MAKDNHFGMRGDFLIQIFAAFLAGFLLAFIIFEVLDEVKALTLPEDLRRQVSRLRIVNRSMGVVLSDFKLISYSSGTYGGFGEVYETYIIAFEDRPGRASADQDYFDVILELKRVKGSEQVTVRAVQLGRDEIAIYLDDVLIGVIKPGIEFLIQ